MGQAIERKPSKNRQSNKDPVLLTALLYLREALLEERYEECKTFIDIAKEFGAGNIQIKLLLENPRRSLI